ncbi:MAG: hypothetical protein ACI3YE_07600, partial [Candidatus Avispirillum sp.]
KFFGVLSTFFSKKVLSGARGRAPHLVRWVRGSAPAETHIHSEYGAPFLTDLWNFHKFVTIMHIPQMPKSFQMPVENSLEISRFIGIFDFSGFGKLCEGAQPFTLPMCNM